MLVLKRANNIMNFRGQLIFSLFLITSLSHAIVFRRESKEQSSSGEKSAKASDLDSVVIPYLDRSQEYYSEGGRVSEPNEENARQEDTYYRLGESSENRQEKLKWKGWNYIDTSAKWTPHEKTVSLQFFDEGRYSNSPPAWPHDEYLLQFPKPYYNNLGLRNSSDLTSASESQSGTDSSKYEWHRLQPQAQTQPTKSIFIGPGFYDSTNFQYNYQYPQLTHQAIVDSSAAAAAAASSHDGSSDVVDGHVPNAVSESATAGKFYPTPYDHYRRKRLRIKLHPGLIAAPIAGFAAYKAVSAIASKPLLFELGYVGNKPNIQLGYPGGVGVGQGQGWGWPAPLWPNPQPQPYPYPAPYPNPYPAQFPNPYPPGIHPIHLPHYPAGQPLVPILTPKRKPEVVRSSWWNPFAALTPRFRSKKYDRTSNPEDVPDSELEAAPRSS